ncbi:hypothetical protein [Tissierella sp.]|uniref:hypothetical protein n=1 Tax=Tissierella sp. TaxID=41274 RepID=UPI0028ADFA89|nr:hypothetical protein [Tissierella sp.]
MKDFLFNFKRYKGLRYYSLFLTLVNSIYLFIEIYKFQYIEIYSLNGQIQKEHYQYISNLSNMTNALAIFMVLIYLVYLVVFLVQKNKINVINYFLVHFIFCIVFTCVSFLISFIFAIPIGNLIQQLVILYGAAIIALLYNILNMLYKRAITRFKN